MSNMNFDPAAFLDMPVSEVSVKRPPIAAGDYISIIKDVVAEVWSSKDKYDDKTGQLKSGIKYTVTLTVEVPEAERTRVGMTQTALELKDSIMLEMNDAGGIDTAPGKNGALRRYRDATDLNKAGDVFQARKMIGKMILVKIAHREYPPGSGDIFEETKGVAKLAGG